MPLRPTPCCECRGSPSGLLLAQKHNTISDFIAFNCRSDKESRPQPIVMLWLERLISSAIVVLPLATCFSMNNL